MRKSKSASIVLSGLAALLLGGCSTTYVMQVPESQRLEHLTAASLKQKNKNYEVLGLVHCERWNGAMYWQSRPEMMRLALDDLNAEASMMGANAVVDVQTKAENHYQFAIVLFFFPFVFGHEEAHVSGTAVKVIR